MKKISFGIIIVGFFLDLFSKILVRKSILYNHSVDLLGSFLRLTYIENPGIVFGIGSGGSVSHQYLFVIETVLFAIAMMIFLYYEYRRTHDTCSKILYMFIFTGALGNCFERIFGFVYYEGIIKIPYGKVVDFIDIGIGEHFRWFIFNFADAYISVSVCILLIRFIILGTPQKQQRR